jgi:hypothetical protein
MQYSDDVNSGSGGTDKVRCRKYDRIGEKGTIIIILIIIIIIITTTTTTIIIIIIRHKLGLDRLVSASSNILFQGLPSCLHLFAL